MVVVGSADSFEDIHAKVQVEKLPAIFYYTAVWCGPCRVMAPVIEKMSRQYHKIPVYKVDIDMYAYDWICAFSFRVIDGFRFLHPYYTAYSFLEIFKKEDSATRLKGYYENDGVHDASADSALLSNAFPEVYLCAHERGWWQGRRACGKAASSASICCHRPRHHEGVTLSCLYITPPHQDTLMGMTFSKAGVCDRVKELWPLSLPQMSMMPLCCHSHVLFILFVR